MKRPKARRRGIKEEAGIAQLWDILSVSCNSKIMQLDSQCALAFTLLKKCMFLGIRTLTAGKRHALEGEDIDFLFIFAILIILSRFQIKNTMDFAIPLCNYRFL